MSSYSIFSKAFDVYDLIVSGLSCLGIHGALSCNGSSTCSRGREFQTKEAKGPALGIGGRFNVPQKDHEGLHPRTP